MDFLGMGMAEIILVLVVAVIIWGPGRIVEIGRTLGKIAATLRKASFDLTKQLTNELEDEEKYLSPQSRTDSGDKTEESADTGKAESNDTEMTSPSDQ